MPERFLGVFVLVMGLGLFLAARWGSPYTAETRLLILPWIAFSQGQAGDPMQLRPALPQEARNAEKEIELLGSPNLHQQTIDRVGLMALYPDLAQQLDERELPAWIKWGSRLKKGLLFDDGQPNTEKLLRKRREWLSGAALQRFKDALGITKTGTPELLSITFKHADPTIAMATLRTLMQAYEQTRNGLYNQGPSDDAFKRRMNHYGELRQDLDKQITEFKLNNNISVLSEQKAMRVKQTESLRDSLMAGRTELGVLNARLESLRKQLAAAPAAGTGAAPAPPAASPEIIARMTETLVELERQKKVLSQGPDGGGTLLRDLNEKIQSLKGFLGKQRNPVAGERPAGGVTARQQLELELAQGITEAVALQKRLELEQADQAELAETLRTYGALESELNGLEEKRDIALQNYRLYAQKVEEARIRDQSIRQSGQPVRVLQPPRHATQDLAGARLIWLCSIPLGLLLALLADRIE